MRNRDDGSIHRERGVTMNVKDRYNALIERIETAEGNNVSFSLVFKDMFLPISCEEGKL